MTSRWRFWRRPRALWPQAWLLMLVLRAIYWPINKWLLKVEVINQGVIPRRGPVILASNHISDTDPVLEMAVVPINRMPVAMAMAELWRVLGLNVMLWLLGQIPVDRKDRHSGLRAFRKAITVLEHNGLIMIYPEAGCSRDGKLRKFKSGVADLAFSIPNAVVIPVHISGSNQLKHPDERTINRSAPVRIAFGTPIESDDFTGTDRRAQYLKNLTERIQDLAPPSYYDGPEDTAPAA